MAGDGGHLMGRDATAPAPAPVPVPAAPAAPAPAPVPIRTRKESLGTWVPPCGAARPRTVPSWSSILEYWAYLGAVLEASSFGAAMGGRQMRQPAVAALLWVAVASFVLMQGSTTTSSGLCRAEEMGTIKSKSVANAGSQEKVDTATDGLEVTRKVILETPYLCRLGRHYPWIRRFVEDRMHLYPQVEWKETGGNPRLLVVENGAIDSITQFRNHKDVEKTIKEKLEL